MPSTYRQYCGLARALELVGKRWNGLIAREPMHGPKRYSDLAEGLPGIGTSVLVGRLADLQREGLVERARLPKPAATTVYALSASGQALADALVPLVAWGRTRLGKRRREEVLRPSWALLHLRSRVRPEELGRIDDDSYELRIGDEAFHLRAREGRLEAHVGRSPTKPALRITTNLAALVKIASGETSVAEALAHRRSAVEGSAEALARFQALFGFA